MFNGSTYELTVQSNSCENYFDFIQSKVVKWRHSSYGRNIPHVDVLLFVVSVNITVIIVAISIIIIH